MSRLIVLALMLSLAACSGGVVLDDGAVDKGAESAAACSIDRSDARAHAAECKAGVALGPADAPICDAHDDCVALCVSHATCAALTGADRTGQNGYLGCVHACGVATGVIPPPSNGGSGVGVGQGNGDGNGSSDGNGSTGDY